MVALACLRDACGRVESLLRLGCQYLWLAGSLSVVGGCANEVPASYVPGVSIELAEARADTDLIGENFTALGARASHLTGAYQPATVSRTELRGGQHDPCLLEAGCAATIVVEQLHQTLARQDFKRRQVVDIKDVESGEARTHEYHHVVAPSGERQNEVFGLFPSAAHEFLVLLRIGVLPIEPFLHIDTA